MHPAGRDSGKRWTGAQGFCPVPVQVPLRGYPRADTKENGDDTVARQRRHAPVRRRRGRFRLLYKFLAVMMVTGAVILACVVFFKINSIEVAGNVRYTQEEVIAASGIRPGDNLMMLSKSRIASAIRNQLPYVEGVSIQRVLPDRVVLRVTERMAAASVSSAEGRWLITAQGKLLEPDTGGGQMEISGLTALAPYAGGKIQVAEEEQSTLSYVLELLHELESRGILEQCSALDCSAATSMTLHYGIYRIKLPRGGDYSYHVSLALSALDSGLSSGMLQEGQGGTLDLTVTEGKAIFHPNR